MSTYAIGDIQGCFDTFQKLLARISWNPGRDRLWLVGDFVNRGPKSLEMLRWLVAHQERVVAVLGNHDLHLLGCAEGVRETGTGDTLREILEASDRDTLLGWLRTLPLMVQEGDRIMVHAGLLPAWSLPQARELSAGIQQLLLGPERAELLRGLSTFTAELTWVEDQGSALHRHQKALSIFTRMRTCSSVNSALMNFSGPPDHCPPGTQPWFHFSVPERSRCTIIFGHWAALGLHLGTGIIGLDSGCVWGRSLTALRLDDHKVFQEAATET